jgi:hypothetical protein
MSEIDTVVSDLTPDDFGIGKAPESADYMPQPYLLQIAPRRRLLPLTWGRIMEMLTEPRIVLGLRNLKGPVIARTKFIVECEDETVRTFIESTIKRFWMVAASRVLKAIEWGFSCSEVTYRLRDGLIYFDNVRDLYPPDCTALVKNGKVVGAVFRHQRSKRKEKRGILSGPRCLWHVHDRDINPYYGRSRLYGALLPWLERNNEGGFRDIRRLCFWKYSLTGQGMRYPDGTTPIRDSSGAVLYYRNNSEIAREILDNARSGSTFAMPGTRDENGNYLWEIIPASTLGPPQGLDQYGEDLGAEESEGLGIPSEVLNASGTGAYAGRQVPQEGFLSTLQELTQWLTIDFVDQSLENLTVYNFGVDSGYYEVTPTGILREEEGIPQTDTNNPITHKDESVADPTP